MSETVTPAMASAGRKEAERQGILGPRQEKWINELAWANIYWAMERVKDGRPENR